MTARDAIQTAKDSEPGERLHRFELSAVLAASVAKSL